MSIYGAIWRVVKVPEPGSEERVWSRQILILMK
jgi:hypothetical protein